MTSVLPPENVISFARGVPSPDLFAVDELAECAERVIRRDGRTVLNYGPPGGYAPLREWLAQRHSVEPARVLATPGSLMAMNLVARAVVAPGDRVLVEAPTYDRARLVFAASGAEVESVPQGDLDALAEALGRRPRLLYLLPSFHNPTGRTLAEEARRRAAEVAREHGVLVYEDDPYGLVRFEGTPPPLLHELGGGAGVVYASSFSKTVAPGLRVGYVVVPDELIAPVERLATDHYVSPPILPQAQLAEYLREGFFEPNLARISSLLRARRDALLAGLEAELPAGATWTRPEGGYFLWLELPEQLSMTALLPGALARGVSYVPGAGFGGPDHAARLAFSWASLEEIAEGACRLGEVVRSALAG
jgi:DNA-binding transcriptional MocR family regulator